MKSSESLKLLRKFSLGKIVSLCWLVPEILDCFCSLVYEVKGIRPKVSGTTFWGFFFFLLASKLYFF